MKKKKTISDKRKSGLEFKEEVQKVIHNKFNVLNTVKQKSQSSKNK